MQKNVVPSTASCKSLQGIRVQGPSLQGFKGAFAASTATDGVTAKSCGYGNDAPKGS